MIFKREKERGGERERVGERGGERERAIKLINYNGGGGGMWWTISNKTDVLS